jgi:hypothetical protein
MKSLSLAVSIAVLVASAAVAGPVSYIVNLSGPNESPSNGSPGTGFATVILDTSAHTLFVQISFQDLIGTTTASHIHCCTAVPDDGTAGVATITPTFTGFPLGVTSGTYTHTYDTSAAVGTWNPAFITANGGTALSAEADFAAGLAAGESYLNIHTSFAPGGEIRGFLEPVPEPATFVMAGAALLGLVLRRRLR